MSAYVYLIHLDHKLKHAGHYLGYTALDSVTERFDRHKSGNGAALLRAVNAMGIDYHVVRVWECSTTSEAKDLERRLKKRKNSPGLCPICNPHAAKYLYTAIVQPAATGDGIPF